MVLMTAAEYNIECRQLDLNTALLKADVGKELYFKLVPGFEEFDQTGVPIIMKLLKAFYSLHQGPLH